MRTKLYVSIFTFAFLFSLGTITNAQVCTPSGPTTFTNTTPVTIPTGPAVVSSSIVVAGMPTHITDINIITTIAHTFPGDLDMTITSPAGTVVTLTTDNGGTNDNVFNGTTWDDDANPGGTVPYTTNSGLAQDHPYALNVVVPLLAPEEALGAFIGENPNGTWTLTISDDAGGDGGTLTNWSVVVRGLNTTPILNTDIFTNNTALAIPTGPAVVSSNLVVAGAGTQIYKVTLTTNITHTFPGDLDMTLTSPSGTVITISTDNAGTNDNVFNGTLWDDDANPSGTVPYTSNNGLVGDHTYALNVLASPLVPEEALAAFFGENPNGTWTITISDDAAGDGGSLASWTLSITTSDCTIPSGPCTPTLTTYTNPTSQPIPDLTTINSVINIAGAPTYLYDLNLITFITHTFPGDLDITLTSPAGTVVTITTDNGASNDDVFNGTVWDDNGGTLNPPGAVTDATFVTGVTETPLVAEEAMGAFIGENPNGTWTLTITDDAATDIGVLNSWSLALRALASPPITASATFSNPTVVPIPVSGIVTSDITVSGMSTQILDVNALTNILHDFPTDLDITITSPAGTVVTLTTDNGGSATNAFNGTVWDDNAGATNPPGAITETVFAANVVETPLTPEEAMGAFVGENPNGTWTLTIEDDFAPDGGQLTSWSLTITTASCTTPVCNVTCPANITAPAAAGLCSAVVNYPAPTTSGTCGTIATFPTSGSTFPVGVTTVNAYNSANQRVYVTGPGNVLHYFNLGTPGFIGGSIPVTGLGGGEQLAGIDFRPANGQLYGITYGGGGTQGRLYTINRTTGAATQVGSTPFTVNGNSVGMDFNPVPDRIRLVMNTGENLRINPNDGTVIVDNNINPAGPGISGVAYINSFNGSTATTLYDISHTDDILYIQNPPNNGTLVAVGPLGVDAAFHTVGFDITADNRAFAILSVASTTGLYTIDLATGAATLVGTVPLSNMRGMAIAPLNTLAPSCSFTVTVNDTQVPTATCPTNISVNAAAGVCNASVVTPNPTTADNCAVTRVTWVATGASPGTSPATGINFVGTRTFAVGVTTVTYTVADAAGNQTTCAFTVTVADTQNPTVTCPANITANAAPGVCNAPVANPNVTNTDNCAVTVRTWAITGATTLSSPATGLNNVGTQTFNVGVSTVTYTVRDATGNTATCQYTVTVVDTQNPVITCPPNSTVTTPVGSCTAVVNYVVTATDNCAVTSLVRTAGLASGSAFPIGVNSVTWRATDAAGNFSECTFTITVLDGQLPVITAQPVNRTVCQGSNATFSVTSTNTLSYQWQTFSGGSWNNIAGATTNSYTVTNATIAMNTNSFRVLVTGLCTTVTSNIATLFVNTNPIITISASGPPALLPGQFITLTANGIPPGGTFVWLKNGTVILGATTNQLVNLGVNDIGDYAVRYTDPNGCVTTSATLTISGMSSENLYVYPNPNFGQFNVRFFNNNPEAVNVIVYDAKGAKVLQKPMTTNLPYTEIPIDLGPTAKSGMYVVILVNQAGRIVGAKQVLVRHQ